MYCSDDDMLAASLDDELAAMNEAVDEELGELDDGCSWGDPYDTPGDDMGDDWGDETEV